MKVKFNEFCRALKVPENQYKRKRADFLEWLSNFYAFEYSMEGRTGYIEVFEQLGDYKPFPRKGYDVSTRISKTEIMKEDYEQFTREALGTEFKPNSKSKIARDAISSFGQERYYHTNAEAVTRRYVKEPFDKYGETNNNQVWVDYKSYKPFTEEMVKAWREILSEEHISEAEAANAWYRQEQGEDTSREKQFYKNALERFKNEYGVTPVLVKEWRCK